MTSEFEALKTNEFLRRRKLRLQQVREQSKDIAKKIRQRAKVEKIRQVVDLDAKKQKEYFECQERLVKELQVLYTRGVKSLGAGHASASELTQQDETVKIDLSKLRGKEATAALRKKRQEKLDQQKKLLDRKLQAREAANEISRDKSGSGANKLTSKPSDTKLPTNEPIAKPVSSPELTTINENNKEPEKESNESEPLKRTDMATQWDLDTTPNDWEPVPGLSLPYLTDKESAKESEVTVPDNTKSVKNKKLDLFALSDEMPSSLRGKHSHKSRDRDPTSARPSVTLVTEYLQTRKLRLRQNEPAPVNKKSSDDLQSLKQTILRTRASTAEGSTFSVCHVLDEEVIPVPNWRAENAYKCPNSDSINEKVPTQQFQNVTNSEINQIFKSFRPPPNTNKILPTPVIRGTSPFKRSKVSPSLLPGKTLGRPEKTLGGTGKSRNLEYPLSKKNSVQMYNHSTRDTRDFPCEDSTLVVRDMQSEEDAYSLAMKEVSAVFSKGKDPQKKVEDMRNKVAVTKQNVEKEYKDTINFLNSLPKDKCSKGIKSAYMDDRRQQIIEQNRQHKMQEEYRKIEKECRKNHLCGKSRKSPSPRSRSPNRDESFDNRDFQYSWMPVPESDGSLAVHAIPNTIKQKKAGHSVKFSKVDSYHEYRSRHKHTPPTKDTGHEKPNKKVVETVIIDQNHTASSDSSSISSDTSSIENLKLDKQSKNKGKTAKEINANLSDAERIIIYKILDSRTERKTKKQTKLLSEIAKSLSSIGKVQKGGDIEPYHSDKQYAGSNKGADTTVSFEQLKEGVYKMVEEKGDNIASMYFPETERAVDERSDSNHPTCDCNQPNRNLQRDKGPTLQWESADNLQPPKARTECRCRHNDERSSIRSASPPKPSSPSTTSFITANNDKTAAAQGGYIKLVDETGHEAGKFFIGSTGLLNNNAYEVVIQLRKKDNASEDRNPTVSEGSAQTKNYVNDTKSTNLAMSVVSGQSKNTTNISKLVDQPTEPPASEVELSNIRLTSEMCMNTTIEPNGISNVESQTSEMTPHKRHGYNREKNHVVTEKVEAEVETAPIEGIQLVDGSGPKSTCDKGVMHNINNEVVTQQKSATTTYTQTSSPARPMLFHMSSSTSTAYLSPPELILPKCLKSQYGTTEDDSSAPTKVIELKDNKFREESACACRKCNNNKKAKVTKTNLTPNCKKPKITNKKAKTPPNTERSPNETRRELYEQLKERRIDAQYKTGRADVKPNKYKYSNCGNVDHAHKFHCQRKARPPAADIAAAQGVNMQIANVASRNNYRPTNLNTRNLAAPDLNPIIKNYVNKLLALNREGLRAVEVADQECSSVGTPGSSIINVPRNLDERKPSLTTTLSLQQIKNILRQQILETGLPDNLNDPRVRGSYTITKHNSRPSSYRTARRRPVVHKVKSLNISKHLLKSDKSVETNFPKPLSPSSTDEATSIRPRTYNTPKKTRCKSSPTPRRPSTAKSSKCKDYHSTTEKIDDYDTKSKQSKDTDSDTPRFPSKQFNYQCNVDSLQTRTNPTPAGTSESESVGDTSKPKDDLAISMSTQTSRNVDSEMNFMKLAEDKLQNMEKIADLTEKCTKRLSNLAKVLEEVRKNKSLVYSQISSESSDSQSDKVPPSAALDHSSPPVSEIRSPEPNVEIKNTENTVEKEMPPPDNITSVLKDIPKPDFNQTDKNAPQSKPVEKLESLKENTTPADLIVKNRPKPPPALSRLHFKNSQEYVIPHELSTVIEVDSPMSVKHKNQSSKNDVKDVSNHSAIGSSLGEVKETAEDNTTQKPEAQQDKSNVNPDLVQSNSNLTKLTKPASKESSDDSKFQMIDLKQFNEIMLEPFLSIQEYAKQYNMEPPDDGSNMEDVRREDVNDDLSSLHSDGSLPDVIAELLKRNVITEPFKFDTNSNMNSTTISSESTLSMLALTKVRKERKRFHNKENIIETSDTLSISSNPDLENAFKKLGMGWASSTLKKTKERLALSSSSNTSSSSLSQFKMKSFNHDIPALVTDSISSAVSFSKKAKSASPNKLNKSALDKSKHVEQQTSLSNSMTVKEFLRNELAKKITFNNKSKMNDSSREGFVSLFETKIPEEMKDTTHVNVDERSPESAPSGANRARTSTPVQIYKSMTYHSSSSSNISNGLFSNIDELSSVKMTSNSIKNHSTSEKDDLTIPNFSLRMKKNSSECSD